MHVEGSPGGWVTARHHTMRSLPTHGSAKVRRERNVRVGRLRSQYTLSSSLLSAAHNRSRDPQGKQSEPPTHPRNEQKASQDRVSCPTAPTNSIYKSSIQGFGTRTSAVMRRHWISGPTRGGGGGGATPNQPNHISPLLVPQQTCLAIPKSKRETGAAEVGSMMFFRFL